MNKQKFSAILSIEPMPAARMTRGQIHCGTGTRNMQSIRYQAWKEEVSWEVKALMKKNRIKKMTGDIAVIVAFLRSGNRRADIDNMVKALLDAFQIAGLYENDNQVTYVEATVKYGAEIGTMIFEIWEV